MSKKAKNLKNVIIKSGEKIGVSVVKGGDADRVITRSTRVAATVINEGEKQTKSIGREVESAFDKMRARIHAATAPQKNNR